MSSISSPLNPTINDVPGSTSLTTKNDVSIKSPVNQQQPIKSPIHNKPISAPPSVQSQPNNNPKTDAELQNMLGETQERLPTVVRPSKAFRNFKNPPQPHMCIKDSNEAGQELYINVMSWTRIVMPTSSEDPIPLYGGMRVSILFYFLWINVNCTIPFDTGSKQSFE